MKAVLFALLAAVLWGVTPIFENIGLRKAHPMIALTIRAFSVALAVSFFIVLSGIWREIPKQSSHTVLYIALGGLAAGLFGQLAYFYSLKFGTPTVAVCVGATYPLIAAMLSIMLLREPVTPGKVIGAVFIVLGVLAIGLDNTLWPKQ